MASKNPFSKPNDGNQISMQTRRLGVNGPVVSAIGLGCMAFSGTYGESDDQESIATVRKAIEAGITLFDTGDFYGMGHNELLLREALKGVRRDRVFIQVKFGALRGPTGAFLGFDARPVSVKSSLAYSLTRLGTDYVDLYQPARLDQSVPIEETAEAIAELVRMGRVRFMGLSEMNADTIRRAHAVHPVTALQIEYSLMSRGLESTILPGIRELGIGLTAYGVLSRGLLAGAGPHAAGEKDIRRRFPRFQGDNLRRNMELVNALRSIAASKNVTVPQLALAWVLSRGPDIVPLIGARNREQLRDSLAALEISLDHDELEMIERAVPPGAASGARYDDAGMSILDSERV